MTQIDGHSFTQLTNLNVEDNLYVGGAVLPDEATAPLVLNSSHLPDVAPLELMSGADTNDYTQVNAGLFMLDAAGDEVWRIWAMNPADGDDDSDNLFIGVGSGENINPSMFGGTENTALGATTMPELVGATGCSAFGARSQQANIGGSGSTSFGSGSMQVMTAGVNTAFGGIAMLLATTLTNSTAVGAVALGVNTTGAEIVAIGAGSLDNATGDGCTAIGDLAANQLLGGNNALVIGADIQVPATYVDDEISIGDVITGSMTSGSEAIIIALQTTDPMILGALWNDNDTLKVSEGP